MDAFENEVLACIYQGFLASSKAAPEQEYEVLAVVAEGFDAGIGERSPAQSLMAVCQVGTNGERGVEQQHALLRNRKQSKTWTENKQKNFERASILTVRSCAASKSA